VVNLEAAPELKKLHGYPADRGIFIAMDNFSPEY